MGKIEEFRSYAERALKTASEPRRSYRERALLLGIAQGWLELAAIQWGPDVQPDDTERPIEPPTADKRLQ